MASLHTKIAYLAPGSTDLTAVKDLPAVPAGHTRVVCLSDTHNEHTHIQVPHGHVLLHAGDILTESGTRYVKRDKRSGEFISMKPEGRVLFENFAKWFVGLPHPHKAVIAGNHDWVLQGLGTDTVREIFEESAKAQAAPQGRVAYLDHDHASVGPLKVFGSPYAHWGGQNDAFMKIDGCDWRDIEDGTHIVMTHMPPVLPDSHNRLSEEDEMVDALHRCGALLQVAGHCHWAHGVYPAKRAGSRSAAIPCVVASICDSSWQRFPSGKGRGDPNDQHYGGYTLFFPVIVADLKLAPPPPTAVWRIGGSTPEPPAVAAMRRTSSTPEFGGSGVSGVGGDAYASSSGGRRQCVVFFGPPTDPGAVKRLMPQMEALNYTVYYFDEADEAVAFLGSAECPAAVDACVAKLGSTGNLGVDVMRAYQAKRTTQQEQQLLPTSSTLLIVHSATAAAHPATQSSLKAEFGVNLFVDQSSEQLLLQALQARCA